MPRTKRAQILMERSEYAKLKTIARREKVSVGELIRTAVRERYFKPPHSRRGLLEELFKLNVPVGDWEQMERDIIDARCDDLPR